MENPADVENFVESLLKSLKFWWKSGKKCDSPFLDSFFLFLECLFLFLLLCILAMFAIHAITQIASKTEKLWAAQKTSSQIYIWRWYYIRGFEQTLYLVRGYNPSVFSACKTSRKSSSPYTGEPRTALRWLSARLYLTALRSRALSLPQSYCSTDFNLEQCGS